MDETEAHNTNTQLYNFPHFIQLIKGILRGQKVYLAKRLEKIYMNEILCLHTFYAIFIWGSH